MTCLNTNDLLWEEKDLFVPTLEEVKGVLSSGLTANFKEVTVDVVKCPDLQTAPFHLAGSGLCGSPTIVEIGGAPYLLPTVDRKKVYNLDTICQKIFNSHQSNEYLAIGAGAGPWPHVSTNCEGIFNLKRNSDGSLNSNSHLARVGQPEENCILEQIPNTEIRLALLGNIYLSQGSSGDVLRVHCKQRIGSDDFIASIRKTLAAYYENGETVGLGGAFLLKTGKAKQHVMREFSTTPINNDIELNEWLKFYDMPSTLIAVGTLVTNEADLDLRVQHFHSFSTNGWGGHYHIDTTPDIAEYEGYFNVGKRVVRIDKPPVTHKYGRD